MVRRPPRSTLFPLHDALPIWDHETLRISATSSRVRNRGVGIRSPSGPGQFGSPVRVACALSTTPNVWTATARTGRSAASSASDRGPPRPSTASVQMEGPLAVSATRTVPTAPGAAAPGPAGPVPGQAPRRVRPPRWLDIRLVLGVLLVLGSVLL